MRHGWHGSEDYPPPISAVPGETDNDLESLFPARPPWNGFDTFLRRALMGGGALLVWALLIAAIMWLVWVVILG